LGALGPHADGETRIIEQAGPLRARSNLMIGDGFNDIEARHRFARRAASCKVENLRLRDVTLLPVLGLVYRDGEVVEATNYAVTPRERERGLSLLGRPHRALAGRPLFSAINRFCNNYYHIIAQVVPAVATYQTDPAFAEGVLLLAEPAPVHYRALELAGIAGGERLVVDAMQPIDVRDLTVSSLLIGNDDPASFALSVYDRMIEAAGHRGAGQVGAGQVGAGPAMIYVWRVDAVHRPLRNEDALVEMLVGYGVEPVVLSTLSLDEQIRLFRDAKLIIGPHGAGLSNVVFAAPGAVLYELLPDHYLNVCINRLAQLRGVHYWCDAHPAANRPGMWRHDVPWSVDIGAVERRLLEIVALHDIAA
jgi:hypothetical protein